VHSDTLIEGKDSRSETETLPESPNNFEGRALNLFKIYLAAGAIPA
jgi:hypothetical protein